MGLIRNVFFATNTVNLVYELAGQSNACGNASSISDPPSVAQPQQNCFIFNQFSGNFETLKAGTNSYQNIDHPEAIVGYGIECKLMDLLLKYYKKKQYLIKAGFPGTYLNQDAGTTPDWNVSSTNELFTKSVNNFLVGFNKFNNFKMKAIIWWQGAQDTANATYSANYQTNLQNFIAGKRAAYSLPNLAFIIVKLSSKQTGLDSTNKATVIAAQVAVAAQANNYIVSTDDIDFSADNIHATGLGYDQVAAKIYNILISL